MQYPWKPKEVAPPPEPERILSDDKFEQTCQFLIQMATQAHCYGASPNRLESYLTALPSHVLGIRGEIFATPTFINFVFWRPTDTLQRHFFSRLPAVDYNLTKLDRLGQMMDEILHGDLTVTEGAARLEQIDSLDPPYENRVVAVGYGLCGASIAVLLSAAWGDVLLAAALSLVVYGVLLWGGRFPRLSQALEVLAALAASLLANTMAALIPGSNPAIVTVCAVVVLIPGLALTQGVAELVAKSILSGMDRLIDGVLITVKLFIGAAIGSAFINALWTVPRPAVPPDIPPVAKWLAVVLLMVGLALVFQIRASYVGWAVLAGTAAYTGVWFGNRFGSWQGAFLGALMLGIYTGLFTRRLRHPASLVALPGIMILVPGIAAYFGLDTLGDSGFILGLVAAWGVVVQISAIVAGLIVAAVLIPGKDSL